jgi:hypothetical protein
MERQENNMPRRDANARPQDTEGSRETRVDLVPRQSPHEDDQATNNAQANN